jgi:hypothetical protein
MLAHRALLLVVQVVYHRDIWTQHSNSWWQPLQRCWGVMEKAAGSQAAAQAGAKA